MQPWLLKNFLQLAVAGHQQSLLVLLGWHRCLPLAGFSIDSVNTSNGQ